jgi:hypothetical protein
VEGVDRVQQVLVTAGHAFPQFPLRRRQTEPVAVGAPRDPDNAHNDQERNVGYAQGEQRKHRCQHNRHHLNSHEGLTFFRRVLWSCYRWPIYRNTILLSIATRY